MSLTIPIETSARHIHITDKDFETLFGPGARPTFARELSQPGQYACKERLTVAGPKGRFEKVVILGPLPERDTGGDLRDGRKASGDQKRYPTVRGPGRHSRLHSDRAKWEIRTGERCHRGKTPHPYDPCGRAPRSCEGQ